jgi:basic amino acid/polyamine antiporter, APA family
VTDERALLRQIGLGGAVVVGLGSIVGTGVFVSIGVAAGVAGPAVILAIGVAALVAACNGLSSAQLAAVHPVSGGTYEYGYRFLGPRAGFSAGWLFLLAKSASAATAALGFAGYLLRPLGGPPSLIVPIAVVVTIGLTGLVLLGARRTNWLNVAVVSITLASLVYFVVAGLMPASGDPANLAPFFSPPEEGAPLAGVLEACALMFVAFTGYGRIATLGEEVKRPERTIPRAVVVTVATVSVLYIAVAYVAVRAIGAAPLAAATRDEAAPLEVAARALDLPGVAPIVSIAALTAMIGVLLNLLLGLSRVLLAMGRRGDMPAATARLNAARTAPTVATVAVGGLVLLLALLGDVRVTWSFSAFTVLLYYAITNAAALRLRPEERLFSPVWAWGGLASCLFLAFWVDPVIWAVGLALVAAGLVWHAVASRASSRGPGWRRRG